MCDLFPPIAQAPSVGVTTVEDLKELTAEDLQEFLGDDITRVQARKLLRVAQDS